MCYCPTARCAPPPANAPHRARPCAKHNLGPPLTSLTLGETQSVAKARRPQSPTHSPTHRLPTAAKFAPCGQICASAYSRNTTRTRPSLAQSWRRGRHIGYITPRWWQRGKSANAAIQQKKAVTARHNLSHAKQRGLKRPVAYGPAPKIRPMRRCWRTKPMAHTYGLLGCNTPQMAISPQKMLPATPPCAQPSCGPRQMC